MKATSNIVKVVLVLSPLDWAIQPYGTVRLIESF